MILVYILIGLTAAFTVFSTVKSPARTKKSIKKSLTMGKSMVPEILGVLAIVALILGLLPKSIIAELLGNEKGILSSISAAIIGAVTIIPGIIAFPLAKELHLAGAAIGAIAAFITTLTMVGIATSPIEYKHFGLKFTVLRNSLSFLFAIGIAFIMGLIL